MTMALKSAAIPKLSGVKIRDNMGMDSMVAICASAAPEPNCIVSFKYDFRAEEAEYGCEDLFNNSSVLYRIMLIFKIQINYLFKN